MHEHIHLVISELLLVAKRLYSDKWDMMQPKVCAYMGAISGHLLSEIGTIDVFWACCDLAKQEIDLES